MRQRRGMLVVAGVMLVAAACGHSRRSLPLTGPGPLANDVERRGRKLFLDHCHQCHPHGTAGLGLSLVNKPLPAFAIKMQIRRGLGAMPAFPVERLDDAGVEAIVAYIERLKAADD